MIKFLIKATAYGVISYAVMKKLDQMQVAERVAMATKPLKDRLAPVMQNLAKLTVPNGTETGK